MPCTVTSYCAKDRPLTRKQTRKFLLLRDARLSSFAKHILTLTKDEIACHLFSFLSFFFFFVGHASVV